MKLDVSYIKLTLTEVRYKNMKNLLASKSLLILLFVHLLETQFSCITSTYCICILLWHRLKQFFIVLLCKTSSEYEIHSL